MFWNIYETEDSSILNRFYFVGHEDTNDIPGEELKIELKENGMFSDFLYEMCHAHINTILVKFLLYVNIKIKASIVLLVNFGMTQEFLTNLMVKSSN